MQAFLGELVFHPSPQTPAQPKTTFLSTCFICVVSDHLLVVQLGADKLNTTKTKPLSYRFPSFLSFAKAMQCTAYSKI